ncbi:MAG: hypothetical protein LWX11_03430 [Firmicutes bacterium]|nr:hypothetical protein [Bacillota bacterium]
MPFKCLVTAFVACSLSGLASLTAQTSAAPSARTLYFSPCSETPAPGEECLQYIHHDHALLLIHHNAYLNCAAINSELTLSSHQDELSITETPIFPTQRYENGSSSMTVAACSCFFTVIHEIKNVTVDRFLFMVNNKHGLGAPRPVLIDLSKNKSGVVTLSAIPKMLRKP